MTLDAVALRIVFAAGEILAMPDATDAQVDWALQALDNLMAQATRE